MSARILDGKRIASALQLQLANAAADLRKTEGVVPHLAAVLVGDDPASKVYVRGKRKDCEACGVRSSVYELPADADEGRLLALIDALNVDPDVHGILIQLPLPEQMNEHAVLVAVAPEKDVDCFHPYNVGLLAAGRPRFLPCTPAGVVEILIRSGIPLSGADAVVVGRSNIVGKPLALMLCQKGADATVTLCHSRTQSLHDHVRRADIVVAAAGQPGLISATMLKPGVVVIDVGINRLPNGKLTGDVDFAAASAVAGAITPVPGGVGPMTRTLLVQNTLRAAAEAAARRRLN